MAFVEEKENSNRAWYGGGLGFIGFDGTINTGLTLRTVRIKAGDKYKYIAWFSTGRSTRG